MPLQCTAQAAAQACAYLMPLVSSSPMTSCRMSSSCSTYMKRHKLDHHLRNRPSCCDNPEPDGSCASAASITAWRAMQVLLTHGSLTWCRLQAR